MFWIPRISKKKMLIIKLDGGLGNQMFQYAVASILAKKRNEKILIDNNSFKQIEKKKGYTPRNFELSIFDNSYIEALASEILYFQQLSTANKLKKKLGFNYPKVYKEKSFGFDENLLSINVPIYLKGYFQSYKYFHGFEDYVRNLFSFPVHSLSQKNIDLIPILQKENTIAIHVRRGDYVTDTLTNQFHGVCSFEYYTKGILEITSKIENPTLVFFSDDCEWVKQNFDRLTFNKIFITHNKGINSWIDMYLMSICSHNIIANSSFSWWAAWLNNNKTKIVVAPKKWFQAKEIDINSIIPEQWIKR